MPVMAGSSKANLSPSSRGDAVSLPRVGSPMAAASLPRDNGSAGGGSELAASTFSTPTRGGNEWQIYPNLRRLDRL